MENLPPSPLAILRTIASHASSPSFSPFLRLEPVERPHDLVAPVGFLLDYPMPYCISNENGRNCLGGVTLQLEEVFLYNHTTRYVSSPFLSPPLSCSDALTSPASFSSAPAPGSYPTLSPPTSFAPPQTTLTS